MAETGVRLEIHRDDWTGGLQLSIGDDHGGYRLIGPKFNGSSKVLAARVLDDRDIAELRRYCDQAEQALNTDVRICEICDGAITDDAEAFDCPRYSGPVHVGCHPADCRSVECREALSDPTGD